MTRSILATSATFFALLTLSISGQANRARGGDGVGIFHEQCIGCHGPNGRAQTEMGKKIGAADLTAGAVQHESDEQLSKIVRDGKGKMPAFEDKLTRDEIRAVIAYVRELASKQ